MRMRREILSVCCHASIILLATLGTADAQVLRIEVENDQRLAVPGASWEIRSGARILTSGAVDSEGEATIPTASVDGLEETLWVRAVGYRPSSVRIPYLAPTTTVTLVVRLEPLAVVLSPVTVAATRFACTSSRNAHLEAGYRIMRQIQQRYSRLREALDMAPLTARGVQQSWRRGMGGRMDVTPDDAMMWVINASTRNLYLSRVQAQGYAWKPRDRITFDGQAGWQFAPILWRYPQHFVDSVFIARHCFAVDVQPVSVGKQRPLKVLFAPRRRDQPEIAGHLWINRATNSLERVQWTFVGLGEDEAAGGDVQFVEHSAQPAPVNLLLAVYVDSWWTDGVILTNTRRWLTEWRRGGRAVGH